MVLPLLQRSLWLAEFYQCQEGQQNAFGDARSDRGEAFGLFEEGDDFLQFFFCFVDASNVIKLDPGFGFHLKRARDLPVAWLARNVTRATKEENSPPINRIGKLDFQ